MQSGSVRACPVKAAKVIPFPQPAVAPIESTLSLEEQRRIAVKVLIALQTMELDLQTWESVLNQEKKDLLKEKRNYKSMKRKWMTTLGDAIRSLAENPLREEEKTR